MLAADRARVMATSVCWEVMVSGTDTAPGRTAGVELDAGALHSMHTAINVYLSTFDAPCRGLQGKVKG